MSSTIPDCISGPYRLRKTCLAINLAIGLDTELLTRFRKVYRK